MKWSRTSSRPQGGLAVLALGALALSLALSACGAATPARPAAQSAPTSAAAQAPNVTTPAQAPKPTVAVQTSPATAEAARPTAAPATAQVARPTAAPAATGETSGSATKPTTAAAGQAGAAFTPRPLAAPLTLKGAGAGDDAPLIKGWGAQYKALEQNLSLEYQDTAGEQSVKDLIAGTAAFVAADAPLTDEQLSQAPDTLHIPVALNAAALAYNLEGVRELRLSPATLAGIFEGTITKWNDPKLAADNPDVALPDEVIVVVHPADGSSVGSLLSRYLGAVDATWKQAAGTGEAVAWPVGESAASDAAIALKVKETNGAIGPVDLSYALAQLPALPLAAIKNGVGAYVTPSLQSITGAAAALKDVPADLRLASVNPAEGKDAYPIAGPIWILVRGTMKDTTQAEALTDFLYWSLAGGESETARLHYAPLPQDLQQRAIAQLGKVTVDGKPVFTAPAQ